MTIQGRFGILGDTASSKISFYGATPVSRQTGTSGSPVTTAPTSTNPFGFSSTQAQQILNAMLALQKAGFID